VTFEEFGLRQKDVKRAAFERVRIIGFRGRA